MPLPPAHAAYIAYKVTMHPGDAANVTVPAWRDLTPQERAAWTAAAIAAGRALLAVALDKLIAETDSQD